MNTLLKLLLTALAVFFLGRILPGVNIGDYVTAIIVSLVISFLNMFIRPLFILITLPATILTFGLFLFVINTVIILIVDELIDNFKIAGFFEAFVFSLLLSILRSFLLSFVKESTPKEY